LELYRVAGNVPKAAVRGSNRLAGQPDFSFQLAKRTAIIENVIGEKWDKRKRVVVFVVILRKASATCFRRQMQAAFVESFRHKCRKTAVPYSGMLFSAL